MRLKVSNKHVYKKFLQSIVKDKLEHIYSEYRKDIEPMAIHLGLSPHREKENFEFFCSEEMGEIIVRCIDLIYDNIKKMEEKLTQQEICEKIKEVTPNLLFELGKTKNNKYLWNILGPNIKNNELYNKLFENLRKMNDIEILSSMEGIFKVVENVMDQVIFPIIIYNEVYANKNISKKIKKINVDFYNDISQIMRMGVFNDLIKDRVVTKVTASNAKEMKEIIVNFTESLQILRGVLKDGENLKFVTEVYNGIINESQKYLSSISPKELFELVNTVNDINIDIVGEIYNINDNVSLFGSYPGIKNKQDLTLLSDIKSSDEKPFLHDEILEPIYVMKTNKDAYSKLFEKIYVDEFKKKIVEYERNKAHYFDITQHTEMIENIKNKQFEGVDVNDICIQKKYIIKSIMCPLSFVKKNYPELNVSYFGANIFNEKTEGEKEKRFLTITKGIDHFGEQVIEIEIGSEVDIKVDIEQLLTKLEVYSREINKHMELDEDGIVQYFVNKDDLKNLVRELEMLSTLEKVEKTTEKKKDKKKI